MQDAWIEDLQATAVRISSSLGYSAKGAPEASR
jgi:hypothetical protein